MPITAQFVGATIVLPEDKMLALEQGNDGRLSLSLYNKNSVEQ
jgi:pyrimidine operon attenuation protein/uracil phosphoribosyltransferase